LPSLPLNRPKSYKSQTSHTSDPANGTAPPSRGNARHPPGENGCKASQRTARGV